jgi:SWI/SNF-related matrix-associated actin-dependent regulator 1 of chromatin subfamily A
MNFSEPKKSATIAQNEKDERVIKITFPYDLDILDKVRSIPGRQYHPENQCWSTPITIETIDSLLSWNFEIDERLNHFVQKVQEHTLKIISNDIPELNGDLFPFQKQGVAFIDMKNGRALIADDMGLGKTCQAISWCVLHPEKRPVLVVCPASLKLNWEREILKWSKIKNIQILSGGKTKKITGEIVIINYDIVKAWLPELLKKKFQVLVLDEVHYIKASSAQRTKAVKKLGKDIPNIIALSGTPIENRPIEIYNVWKLLSPETCPNYFYFTKHFCNAHNNGFGMDISGSSNQLELNALLSRTIMLRRKKSDVLKDLPDKIRSFVPLELSNEKEYKSAENDFIAFIRKEKGLEAAQRASNAESFAKIEGLKQLAVKGKLKQVTEWIENFLKSDQKLVVFATHKFVIEELMNTFKDVAVKLDGSVSQTQRQKAVDDFQTNEKIKLFVGNIQASGVGITLHASSNVAFVELPWSNSAVEQAIDRCHRIGQKFTVNVYFLMSKNTIEEKLMQLIDTKKIITDAVVDGEETPDGSLLIELMKSYYI